jgi:hypothetical protein
MAVTGRSEPVKQVCQPRDKPQAAKPQASTTVPASWKLTPQQQAFIDTFTEDETPKQ